MSTTTKQRTPGLTLSQRRALLRLLDEGSHTPASEFRALPFVYLVEVGYAKQKGDAFSLTKAGQARAESVNPGYRDWSAGETVVTDGEGNVAETNPRPKHGTHRAERALAMAAAAKAADATPED